MVCDHVPVFVDRNLELVFPHPHGAAFVQRLEANPADELLNASFVELAVALVRRFGVPHPNPPRYGSNGIDGEHPIVDDMDGSLRRLKPVESSFARDRSLNILAQTVYVYWRRNVLERSPGPFMAAGVAEGTERFARLFLE